LASVSNKTVPPTALPATYYGSTIIQTPASDRFALATMAEKQPSELHEGAADPHAPTGTADDRKAAAALSNLDVQEDASERRDVDGKALDKAMKGLSVTGANGVEKKSVKIEAADVSLLVCLQDGAGYSQRTKTDKLKVSELELPKPKATELLRAHEGNALKALRAYITTAP